MNDDDYLDTTELADVMGLPRATIDKWRTPAPRYRWTYDRIARRSVRIEVPQAPPIVWSKVNGRIRYHVADVEAFLEAARSSRSSERMARLQQLKKVRSETGSISLEDLFK